MCFCEAYRRERKLREAKISADEEVERFRRKKEEEFRQLQERKEDRQFEIDLRAKTDQEIDQIRADFNRNKDRVVQMLVQNVLNVDLEIPVSIREKFTKKE